MREMDSFLIKGRLRVAKQKPIRGSGTLKKTKKHLWDTVAPAVPSAKFRFFFFLSPRG